MLIPKLKTLHSSARSEGLRSLCGLSPLIEKPPQVQPCEINNLKIERRFY